MSSTAAIPKPDDVERPSTGALRTLKPIDLSTLPSFDEFEMPSERPASTLKPIDLSALPAFDEFEMPSARPELSSYEPTLWQRATEVVESLLPGDPRAEASNERVDRAIAAREGLTSDRVARLPYAVGDGVADAGRKFVAEMVGGTLGAPLGMSDAGRHAANSGLTLGDDSELTAREREVLGDIKPQMERLRQERRETFEQWAQKGQQIRDEILSTISPAGQERLAGSTPSGNLFKGEIDLGSDPTVSGYALQVAGVLGSFLPMLATTLVTRSPTAGAAVGGGMSAGEGSRTARDYFAAQSHEALYENVPNYRALVDSGVDPEQAKSTVTDQAAEAAAAYQGLVGSLGDRVTTGLVMGQFSRLLGQLNSRAGRAVAGFGASGLEEAAQEVGEGVAADIGIAQQDPTKEIGEDSAANAVLGFGSGAAIGGTRGAMTGGDPQAALGRAMQAELDQEIENPAAVDQQAREQMQPPTPTVDRSPIEGVEPVHAPGPLGRAAARAEQQQAMAAGLTTLTGAPTTGVDPAVEPTPTPTGPAATETPVNPPIQVDDPERLGADLTGLDADLAGLERRDPRQAAAELDARLAEADPGGRDAEQALIQAAMTELSTLEGPAAQARVEALKQELAELQVRRAQELPIQQTPTATERAPTDYAAPVVGTTPTPEAAVELSPETAVTAPVVESTPTSDPKATAPSSPPSKADEIEGVFGGIAQGMSEAAHESAVDRFKRDGAMTYRQPDAVHAAKNDPRYNTRDNPDGSVDVIGLLDPRTNEWVGLPPADEASVTPSVQAPPDIARQDGTPFPDAPTAERARVNRRLGNEYAPVQVGDGWVLRQAAPTDPTPTTSITREPEGDEIVAIEDDPRLKNPDTREQVRALAQAAGWSEEGGRVIRDADGQVTGRTRWIPRYPFWEDRPDGVTKAVVDAAVKKFEAGQPLNKPERAALRFLTDTATVQDWVASEEDTLDHVADVEQSTADLAELRARYEAAFDDVVERVAVQVGDSADQGQFAQALARELEVMMARERSGPAVTPASPNSQDGFALAGETQADLDARRQADAQRARDDAARLNAEAAKQQADGARESFNLSPVETNPEAQQAADRGQMGMELGPTTAQADQWPVNDASAQGANENAPDGAVAAPTDQQQADQRADPDRDFRAFPFLIEEALSARGDLAKLHRAAGVRGADAFNGLPIDDRARAYASFVQGGGDPVAVPSGNNTWVREEYRKADQRRRDNEDPRRRRDTFDYNRAQAELVAEMGLQEDANGELIGTDEQLAELDRRITARRRGEAPAQPTTPPVRLDTDIARADGQPFQNEKTARTAAKNRRLADVEPVQVDGGWVLRGADATQKTRAAPSAPSQEGRSPTPETFGTQSPDGTQSLAAPALDGKAASQMTDAELEAESAQWEALDQGRYDDIAKQDPERAAELRNRQGFLTADEWRRRQEVDNEAGRRKRAASVARGKAKQAARGKTQSKSARERLLATYARSGNPNANAEQQLDDLLRQYMRRNDFSADDLAFELRTSNFIRRGDDSSALARDLIRESRLLDRAADPKQAALIRAKLAADLKPDPDIRFSRRDSLPRTGLVGGQVAADAAPVLEHDAVEAIVEQARRRFGRLSFSTVRAESALPQEIQDQAEQQGATGQVKAVHHKGQVWVVSEGKFSSALEVEEAIAHEVMGHAGVRALFGEAIKPELEALYFELRDPGVKRAAKQAGVDLTPYLETAQTLPRGQRAAYLVDELLAQVQGAAVYDSLPTRAKKAIQALWGAMRAWLREHGLPNLARATDSDLQYLLHRMRQAVQGKASPGAAGRETQFMFAGERDNAELSKSQKLSALLDMQAVSSAFDRANLPDIKAARDAAKKHYDRLRDATENEGFGAITPDGKQIKFSGRGFKEVANHAADRRVLQAAANLDRLFGSAIHLYETASHKTDQQIRAFHYYGVKADFGNDGEAFVLLEVAERNNGEFFYDADATSVEEIRAATLAPLAVQSKTGAGGERAAHKGRLAEWVRSVNQDDAQNATPDIRFSRSGANNTDPVLAEARRKAGLGPRLGFVQRVRASLDPLFEAVTTRREETIADLRQGWLDQFHGIRRAEQRNLGNLPTEQSAYVAARLATGTASVMRAVLLHGRPRWADNRQHLEKIQDTQGLLDILRPLGNQLDDWIGWMVGNRAARLMQEGRENNFTPEEIAALRDLGKDNLDLFRETARQFAAFKRSILDVAEGAGLIDPHSRAVWDHADWIPFYRNLADQDATLAPRSHGGLANQSSGIRTLRGGQAALNDPMENIIMNFHHLLDASLKNNAVRKAIAAAPDAVEKLPPPMQQVAVSNSEVKRVLKAQGVPEDLIKTFPSQVFEGISKLWSFAPPNAPDIIRVMEDGKATYYRVTDPLLLKAVTSFESFDMPGLATARAFKRLFTGAVTASPEFMIRNFLRDTASTAIISRSAVDAGGALRGIAQSLTGSGAAEQMLFAGASFASGYIDGADPEAITRSVRRSLRARGMSASAADAFIGSLVDTPAKFWDTYRQINEAVENANREAVFAAVEGRGGSVTEAAFESKDLMDFSLRGSSKAYRLLADVVPFFNARVQGLYRLGRTDPKQLVRRGLMLAVPSILLAMANMGDDDYEDLPDWDKDLHWHFWIGDEHFRVPKPFEVGLVFGTVPERVVRYLAGQDEGKRLLGRLWWGLSDTLHLVDWPQVVKPAVEVAYNWDSFRGRPIESMAETRYNTPSQRYSGHTSETLREIVQAGAPVFDKIGLSPKKAEHLVGGYLGTMGLWGLSVVDLATRMATDAPERPTWRADDIPLLRVLYRGDRSDPARNTQAVEDVYKAAQMFAQMKGDITDAGKRGDRAQAQQLLERHRERLELFAPAAEAAEYLTDASKQINAIYADRSLTPEQKRKRVDVVLARRNEIARRAAARARAARP